MRSVSPSVHLIGRPSMDAEAITDYLTEVDGMEWWDRVDPLMYVGAEMSEGEGLVEFAARLCYRSWKPGLNANVTKVREDSKEYFGNILDSGHGSVLEHGFYVFVFHNVSRVFTHELVRHRVGVSISQESMRFVRLTDIPFWQPDWAQQDPELMERANKLLGDMEEFQVWMADHFGLDDEGVPFAEKKAKTSYMRRYAPDGVATSIVWGANYRTLRHVIEMRTSPAAEEEIVKVFDEVANIMMEEAPNIMQDLQYEGDGHWTDDHRKV